MMTNTALAHQIAAQVDQVRAAKILQVLQVGRNDRQNELLLFVKPEIFLAPDREKRLAALQLVFAKLAEFAAEMDGVVIVGGPALEEKEIMNRHYGYINELSRRASTLIGEEDRATVRTLLRVSADVPVYGGHEYLQTHASMDALNLDRFWLGKKSLKLRSGFYVQGFEREGEQFVLVNGFHPAQLAHFTNPDRRIVLVLLHSDTDWGVLRNEMVGATFPEKATPGSIRGSLYADPGRYGFESVSIANNGVHLSAGPYEGAFEIMNFFGRLFDLDPAQQTPLIFQCLMDRGLTLEQALTSLDNPTITVNGGPIDLFTATEDRNTPDAVDLWLQEA